MTLSMYQASVPLFVRQLNGLRNILDKAEEHCSSQNIDESVLLQMRIFPDMFHMGLQVKTTLFHSGGAAARLADLNVFDYFSADDSSFAALKKQTTEALQLLQGIKPEQIDGSENRMIEVKLLTYSLVFTREDFLLQFTIPQLYFHAATAYGILRSAGLELGKPGFLGEMPN